MQIITDVNPTSAFTRIPNEVINSDLSDSEFRLWVKMLADLKADPDRRYLNAAEAAKSFGMKVDNFRNRRRALKAKGYMVDESRTIMVTIPSPDFVAAPVITEEEECSIAVEQRKETPRKATLKKAERKTLIKEAWNTHLPDNELWLKLEGALPEPAYAAIEAHTKFLGIERDDYDAFIGQVLRGAQVDPYWSTRRKSNVKFWSLFGWVEYYQGAKGPDDQTFRRVKELYNLGATTKAKEKAFDGSDKAFVEWFQSKGLTDFVKVERITVEDAIEASGHELQTSPTDTILVYQDAEGKVLHWTYKYKHNSIAYLPS